MRILVFGGREFGKRQHGTRHKPDWVTVYEQHCAMQAINAVARSQIRILHWPKQPIEIISGMASGADRMGVIWAERNGCKLHAFPADWNQYGKRAGFLRNQQMLDEGKPDYAIEFPGGNGTADMHRRLQSAGVPIVVVPYTAPSGRVSIWPRSNAWRRQV